MIPYTIHKDLFSSEQVDRFESSVLNEHTQWIFNRYAAYKGPAYNVSEDIRKKNTGFRHVIFMAGKMIDRDMYDIFKIIPEKLGAKNIYNMICQLQLVPRIPSDLIKHIDMPLHKTPYRSIVYYVNNSDAPTILYNKDGTEMVRCEHERGKLIDFDGSIQHCASRPTIDVRCVMNFCYD
jgi:hypothetical protein